MLDIFCEIELLSWRVHDKELVVDPTNQTWRMKDACCRLCQFLVFGRGTSTRNTTLLSRYTVSCVHLRHGVLYDLSAHLMFRHRLLSWAPRGKSGVEASPDSGRCVMTLELLENAGRVRTMPIH
jgi:hypothetical protein